MRRRHFIALLSLLASPIPAFSDDIVFGEARFSLPENWNRVSASDERSVFQSKSGDRQLTVSKMNFGKAPTLADFKRLCQLRLDAERKAAPSVYVEPGEPREEMMTAIMSFAFSGLEPQTHRAFSGRMIVSGAALTTLYFESINVAPPEHRAEFERIEPSLSVSHSRSQ